MNRNLDKICKECGQIFDPHGAQYHTSHTPGNHFCVRLEILEDYMKPRLIKRINRYGEPII